MRHLLDIFNVTCEKQLLLISFSLYFLKFLRFTWLMINLYVANNIYIIFNFTQFFTHIRER